jgi:hypothetical protein
MEDWELAFDETGFSASAGVVDRLRKLNDWHFDFAKQHRASFSATLSLIEAVGLKPLDTALNLRSLHSFQKGMKISERRALEHEIQVLSELPSFSAPGLSYRGHKKKKKTAEERLEELIIQEKVKVEGEANLSVHFLNSLISLKNKRNSQILISRLGIDQAEALTLEAAGKEHGLARQRVSQIEKRALLKIEKSALWDDIFREKCNEIFKLKGPVILARDLGELDQWFSGFNLPKSGWRLFLKYFSGGLRIVDENGVIALTTYEAKDGLEKTLKQARDSLRNGDSKEAVASKIMSACDYLIDKGAYYSSAILHLAGDQRVSLGAIVRAIMDDADRPLTLEDVIVECARRDHQVARSDYLNIKNVMADVSVPISRTPTVYVTKKSIGLTDLQIRQFCDAFESYWLEKFKAERVFHGDEIKAWAVANGFEQSLSTSSWMYTAILQLDPERRFAADKLQIWLTASWEKHLPPNLEDLIAEILRVKGIPLTRKEITQLLYADHGVGTSFQIHEKSKIKFLGNGLWAFRNP